MAYPFQDLTTPQLAGEQWRDIPDQKGRYQVSNLGRVRRLAHTRVSKRGYKTHMIATILYQQVSAEYSKTNNDYRARLAFSITGDANSKTFSTSRIVYYCFVEPFDLQNRNLFVLFRDYDSLNVSAENLYLGDSAEKFKQMKARNRWAPAGKPTPEHARKKLRHKAMQRLVDNGNHLISQYDLDGKLIRTFFSSKEAAKMIGINAGSIRKAARNYDCYTAGGYIWRRGNAEYAELPNISKITLIYNSPLAKHAKPISQYSLTGDYIRSFATIQEAELYYGSKDTGNIRAVLRGERYTSMGFIWRRGERKKIDPRKGVSEVAYRNSALSKAERIISQYNLDGIFVGSYANTAAAERETGIKANNIRNVIDGRNICAGGFLWKFGQALRINLAPYKKRPGIHLSPLGKHLKTKQVVNKGRQR